MISNIFEVCVSISTWNECSVLMSWRMLVLFIFHVASIAAWAYVSIQIIQIFEIWSLKLETFFSFKICSIFFFLMLEYRKKSAEHSIIQWKLEWHEIEIGFCYNEGFLFNSCRKKIVMLILKLSWALSQPWNLKVRKYGSWLVSRGVTSKSYKQTYT